MREVENVRQQYVKDEHYYTGDYGQGFLIKDAATGEVVETAPTPEQAAGTIERLSKKWPGTSYEVVSAGNQDAKGHVDGSPFKFVPINE